MRQHAANIFKINNRRRGEWNPLLLVMFALLTVAPSVLSAAPIHRAANQPQAVWQWLQSPEGAPTRDLIQQTFDLENLSDLPSAEIAALLQCGMRNVECGIDNPLRSVDNYTNSVLLYEAAPISAPIFPAVRRLPSLSSSFLSSHEAAKLSGIRTNRRLN